MGLIHIHPLNGDVNELLWLNNYLHQYPDHLLVGTISEVNENMLFFLQREMHMI